MSRQWLNYRGRDPYLFLSLQPLHAGAKDGQRLESPQLNQRERGPQQVTSKQPPRSSLLMKTAHGWSKCEDLPCKHCAATMQADARSKNTVIGQLGEERWLWTVNQNIFWLAEPARAFCWQLLFQQVHGSVPKEGQKRTRQCLWGLVREGWQVDDCVQESKESWQWGLFKGRSLQFVRSQGQLIS